MTACLLKLDYLLPYFSIFWCWSLAPKMVINIVLQVFNLFFQSHCQVNHYTYLLRYQTMKHFVQDLRLSHEMTHQVTKITNFSQNLKLVISIWQHITKKTCWFVNGQCSLSGWPHNLNSTWETNTTQSFQVRNNSQISTFLRALNTISGYKIVEAIIKRFTITGSKFVMIGTFPRFSLWLGHSLKLFLLDHVLIVLQYFLGAIWSIVWADFQGLISMKYINFFITTKDVYSSNLPLQMLTFLYVHFEFKTSLRIFTSFENLKAPCCP